VSDLRIFVLDLETVRNDLAWTPPPGRPDALAPAPCWDIVCIGGMLLTATQPDEGPATVKATLKIVSGASPVEAVQTVARIANEATLVSFNGRGFDFPVMEATLIRAGVSAPSLFRKSVRGRYDAGHQDVCDYLSNHGSTAPFSQDLWSRAVGLPGKGAVSGGDVAAMMAEGRTAEVNAYCLADVLQLAIIYLDTVRAAAGVPAWLTDAFELAAWKAARENPALEWVWSCPRATRHLEKQAA
jgi:hypothetical protein